MWSIIASICVGAAGVVWGSNHPQNPFGDMYNSVEGMYNSLKDTLGDWFGTNKQEE